MSNIQFIYEGFKEWGQDAWSFIDRAYPTSLHKVTLAAFVGLVLVMFL